MTEKTWSRRDVLKGTGALSAVAVVPGLEVMAAPVKGARRLLRVD